VTDEERMNAGLHEERLADQVADLADRIARGESPDLGQLEKLDARGAESLRRLLPAIRLLTEIADEGATEDHAHRFTRPPDVLGDFKIGREIGRGGIGVVYEATQISMGRRVAVKVLPPAPLLNLRQLRRFEIEGQAVAGLQHPNIVPVFAYGTERGLPYFAMRLIEGRTLAEVLFELRAQNVRGSPPREAAELGRQAAEALDYAHRNEVLHRDIKPSNFLVDAVHRLWIADFGLARVWGDSDLNSSADGLGSLRYQSPEQAGASRCAVDGRSDLYALGATLYELVTLRQLFEGGDRNELLKRIVSEDARFSRKLDAAIPVDLQTIVLKTLAKDPRERYATAGDLAGDLTLFLADQPIRARPPRLVPRVVKRAQRHWRPIAGVGFLTIMLLIGAVAAALWASFRLRIINERLAVEKVRAEDDARVAQDQARHFARHAAGAQLRLAALALGANRPARAQEILGNIPQSGASQATHSFARRYLWRQARREIVVLVGPTPHLGGMALSHDGKLLATTDESAGIQLWDAKTGAAIRNIDTRPGRRETPTFASDDSLVAVADRNRDVAAPDGFLIWDVASGRQVVRLPMEPGYGALKCAFLPEMVFLGLGHREKPAPTVLTRIWRPMDDPSHPALLAQVEGRPNIRSASAGEGFLTLETESLIFLRDVGTGKPTQRFDVKGSNRIIKAWASSRGAKVVAAVLAPGWKLNLWDGETGKLLASHGVADDVHRLRFSPDGAALAAVDRRGDVQLIERTTGAIRRIACGHAEHVRDTRIAFSPDSTRLATVVLGVATGAEPQSVSIWATATAQRLATFPGRPEVVGDPIFTPDGQSLLISSRSGVRRWRLAPATDDQDRQPAGHKAAAWSLAFSPDGRTLATGSGDDSEPDPTIKLWDTATGQLTRGWDGGQGMVSTLAISPDGLTVASGHLALADNVRIWETATGRLTATLRGHTDRVRGVFFARDGQTLASASSDGTVRIWDVPSRTERGRLEGHAGSVHAAAFSPDGKTLASAGQGGDVRLFDLSSGEYLGRPSRVLNNRSNVIAVAFAPDGLTVAAADDQGTTTLWDLERSAPIRSIPSDGDRLFHLAFTPDGTSLAATGTEGLIRLWDPSTGQELMSLSSHRAQINGLAFSPDGSILGSVAHDGSVRLWRAEP
jgi:eukaryotic-like serine/threonine-protein kinase